MNNYLIETEEYKGYTINVYYDEIADYNDCDHLGTFYTNVPRYLDPDGHEIDEILDENGKVENAEYVYVIVYAYIHSGIALSTSRNKYPFTDPWDSGVGGIMAVSKEQVKKMYGHKIVTKKDRERTLDTLTAEVRELNAYCQGDVYGYVIHDENNNEIDSCWGYVGDIDYCLGEARKIIDSLVLSDAR